MTGTQHRMPYTKNLNFLGLFCSFSPGASCILKQIENSSVTFTSFTSLQTWTYSWCSKILLNEGMAQKSKMCSLELTAQGGNGRAKGDIDSPGVFMHSEGEGLLSAGVGGRWGIEQLANLLFYR